MKLLFPSVIIAFAYSLVGCATDVTSATAPARISSLDQPGLPLSTPLQGSALSGPIPSGFVGFCLRNADQCDTAKQGPTTIALNLQNFALITQINRTVNQDIKPEDDSLHYGPT